jgi:hypothetical protein
LKISASEQVLEMTLFVAAELFQGVVNDVRVLFTQESAEKAEQGWFSVNAITDDVGRERKGQNGTEFTVHEWEVKS